MLIKIIDVAFEKCVSGDGVSGDIDGVDYVNDGALARPTSQPFAFLRPCFSVPFQATTRPSTVTVMGLAIVA